MAEPMSKIQVDAHGFLYIFYSFQLVTVYDR